jgi:hypothetical protein
MRPTADTAFSWGTTLTVWLILIVLVAVSSGCVNPMNTSMPTFQPAHPRVEGVRYRLHDPFADENLGPETVTRPPSFQDQRAEPRQSLEGRTLLGVDPFYNVPTAPPLSSNYPGSIQ